jgi:hypothetical protein
MKTRGKHDWLDEMFDYEIKHPVVFASPRALIEARLIAELEKNHRNSFEVKQRSIRAVKTQAKLQEAAKKNGTEKLTLADVNAEIDSVRGKRWLKQHGTGEN